MFTRKNRNGIQEMSRSSGHHSIRRKSPRETHFSANSSKRFSLQKKSYPPARLFQITIFRRCDPRTRTWSDSASEDYASSSFPFERASELSATFHSQVIVKDPSTEYHDSQRISPAEDTQTRQKIINNHNIVISR